MCSQPRERPRASRKAGGPILSGRKDQRPAGGGAHNILYLKHQAARALRVGVDTKEVSVLGESDNGHYGSLALGRFDSAVTSITSPWLPAFRADCRMTTSSWRSTSALIDVGNPLSSWELVTAAVLPVINWPNGILSAPLLRSLRRATFAT